MAAATTTRTTTTTTTTTNPHERNIGLLQHLEDAKRAGHLKSFTDEDECVKENVVVYQPAPAAAAGSTLLCKEEEEEEVRVPSSLLYSLTL